MPIRAEMRWFYPIDWPQLSRHVRFERGDCRAIGGQAAAATLGSASFAAKKRCPKLAPNVPL